MGLEAENSNQITKISLYDAILAEDFFDNGKIDKAISMLKKVISEYPNYSTAYISISKYYAEKGVIQKAIQYVQKGITLDRYNMVAVMKLAEYSSSSNDISLELEAYRKLLNFFPKDILFINKIEELEERLKNEVEDDSFEDLKTSDENIEDLERLLNLEDPKEEVSESLDLEPELPEIEKIGEDLEFQLEEESKKDSSESLDIEPELPEIEISIDDVDLLTNTNLKQDDSKDEIFEEDFSELENLQKELEGTSEKKRKESEGSKIIDDSEVGKKINEKIEENNLSEKVVSFRADNSSNNKIDDNIDDILEIEETKLTSPKDDSVIESNLDDKDFDLELPPEIEGLDQYDSNKSISDVKKDEEYKEDIEEFQNVVSKNAKKKGDIKIPDNLYDEEDDDDELGLAYITPTLANLYESQEVYDKALEYFKLLNNNGQYDEKIIEIEKKIKEQENV